MNGRRIEERFEMPNGIKGEWEPSRVKVNAYTDKEYKEEVKRLNSEAKKNGSYLRYRSVANDE